MKRIITGCLIGMLGLASLHVVLAQDATAEPTDSQVLTEPTTEVLPIVLSPTLEIVPSETPIPTTATDIPAETTETPGLDITATQTGSPTAITETQAVIILPPADGTVPIIGTQTFTPGPTATLELRSISGQALYPNHITGQAFIRIQAFAPDNTLVGTTTTDARGNYALTILANQVTRLDIDAPLHLTETLYIAPGVSPLLVILRAGDLDGDNCVGLQDINMLTASYGKSFAGADIDGNGVVDVIDLTLLSGNYDGACDIAAETPTPGVEIVDPVATNEVIVTAEIIATSEVIPTEAPLPTDVLATAEVTPVPEVPTATPLPLPTETHVPVEPTAETTAQL